MKIKIVLLSKTSILS